MAQHQEKDPLVQGHDGLYAVCFKNNKELNADDIRLIFMNYGEVMNIRNSKEGNWVFVRFKSEEEAISAINDTSLHTDIGDTVKPAKSSPAARGESGPSTGFSGPQRGFSGGPFASARQEADTGDWEEGSGPPQMKGPQRDSFQGGRGGFPARGRGGGYQRGGGYPQNRSDRGRSGFPFRQDLSEERNGQPSPYHGNARGSGGYNSNPRDKMENQNKPFDHNFQGRGGTQGAGGSAMPDHQASGAGYNRVAVGQSVDIQELFANAQINDKKESQQYKSPPRQQPYQQAQRSSEAPRAQQNRAAAAVAQNQELYTEAEEEKVELGELAAFFPDGGDVILCNYPPFLNEDDLWNVFGDEDVEDIILCETADGLPYCHVMVNSASKMGTLLGMDGEDLHGHRLTCKLAEDIICMGLTLHMQQQQKQASKPAASKNMKQAQAIRKSAQHQLKQQQMTQQQQAGRQQQVTGPSSQPMMRDQQPLPMGQGRQQQQQQTPMGRPIMGPAKQQRNYPGGGQGNY